MKNQHKRRALLLILLFNLGRANALDAFECVRDLMPITAAAGFQLHRMEVEKPFLLSEKFMAFPEVKKGELTGFYIYSRAHAYYYDRVGPKDGAQVPIAALKRSGESPLYTLVAQPEGLETISLYYMPGFGNDGTTREGPVMLGSSIMPVIGAFVSRTNEQLHLVYHDPREVDDGRLKQWIYDHMSRKPAAVSAIEIQRKMLHLSFELKKSNAELMAPLTSELRLRRQWLQNHNLDEGAFRKFSRIMETTCK